MITETFGPLPTVLVLGHARHGKDTAAEILSDLAGWSFRPSSLFVVEKAVYPTLSERYGYTSLQGCYADRSSHREEWRDLVREYNQGDRTRLARELLAQCNVYVGMRCHREYYACQEQGLFDHVLWVDASERVPDDDTSLTITYHPSMRVIDNNGTHEELEEQVKGWLYERQ